eukprot:2568129-Pleurochrysis_carterae.AAC.1
MQSWKKARLPILYPCGTHEASANKMTVSSQVRSCGEEVRGVVVNAKDNTDRMECHGVLELFVRFFRIPHEAAEVNDDAVAPSAQHSDAGVG